MAGVGGGRACGGEESGGEQRGEGELREDTGEEDEEQGGDREEVEEEEKEEERLVTDRSTGSIWVLLCWVLAGVWDVGKAGKWDEYRWEGGRITLYASEYGE